MQPIAKRLLVVAIIAVLAGGAYYYYASHDKSATGAPAAGAQGGKGGGRGAGGGVQTVRAAIAEKKSLPVTVTANGSVVALNSVDVRPQVQNVVRAIHVKEGQDVKAGQLLFTLDERGDASNVERAQAQIAKDRADLADAEIVLKRNQELLARGFVSQSVVDSAKNKADALRGTLAADQAAARTGGVALGYNRITASIAGRLGAINARVGSLAQPSATLTTIAQIDPIGVSFTIAEKDLATVMSSYPNGDAPVTAVAANGREVQGKLIFIDNAVDTATGTVRMKAQFPNADKALWPGAFASVKMVLRTLPDAVVVPAQAVVTGPVDQFVYVVQPDSTVQMQKVKTLAIESGQAAITGIASGARVVVEGAQNLRPGGKVREPEPAPKAGAAGGQGRGGANGAGAGNAGNAARAGAPA